MRFSGIAPGVLAFAGALLSTVTVNVTSGQPQLVGGTPKLKAPARSLYNPSNMAALRLRMKPVCMSIPTASTQLLVPFSITQSRVNEGNTNGGQRRVRSLLG